MMITNLRWEEESNEKNKEVQLEISQKIENNWNLDEFPIMLE